MGISQQRAEEQAKKRAYWREHLEVWQSSGESASSYCRSQGISVDNFKYWQYQLFPHTKISKVRSEFMEVCISESQTSRKIIQGSVSDGVVIETPGGYKIKLSGTVHSSELLLILHAIRQIPC